MSVREASTVRKEAFEAMRATGRAIMLTGGNNTHSGNISLRNREDRDEFFITASGSQQGALVPSDVVPVKFSSVSWGDGRASTESTIHRRILAIPGVEAAVHCHYLAAASISFDSKQEQNYLTYEGDRGGIERYSFVPIDCIGAHLLGNVASDSYREPVGSKEMEQRIPGYLEESPVTLVKGHGPFVRGDCLATCLHLLGLVELSATLKITARLRGVDTATISRRLHDSDAQTLYPFRVRRFDPSLLGCYETDDERTISAFLERAQFNFYRSVSPFGTGSMSEKVTQSTMLYCPTASAPEGFEVTISRIDLTESSEDDFELAFHKALYRETNYKTCMITMSPLANAEAMAVIAERFGMDALLDPASAAIDSSGSDGPPVIRPIDAEAVYLNPKVGLVSSSADFDTIANMLRRYKGACFVAGVGAIGAGAVSLEQAAHHVASGENLARIRQIVHLSHFLAGGPPVSDFEPETS